MIFRHSLRCGGGNDAERNVERGDQYQGGLLLTILDLGGELANLRGREHLLVHHPGQELFGRAGPESLDDLRHAAFADLFGSGAASLPNEINDGLLEVGQMSVTFCQARN